MREAFEKLAEAGKIEPRHIEPLVRLATCGFCWHRSWGLGRIRSVDPVFARFTIDFPGRPGHMMALSFASEVLQPIPATHILARKSLDLEGLRQMAATQPLELVRIVLESYGGRATVDQIQQALVPDVIAEDWKAWWDQVRKQMKRDGHFQLPLKKGEPVVYQKTERTLDERLLETFAAAKGLKARLAVVAEIMRSLEDLVDKAEVARQLVAALNEEIASHQRTQPALAMEAIFVRDELAQAAGLPAEDAQLSAVSIWAAHPQPGPILEALPAAKHRRALEAFQQAWPDRWPQLFLEALNQVSARVCRELTQLLIQAGHLESLKETLARHISHHTASSELLLWLGKERSDSFADILGPEVFRAMLTALERDQFQERRSSRLRDFILDDASLIAELTAAADIEVIKDLTRALQFSPVFDDMDKRSLLARIVKSHPAIQSLITGEQTRQDTSFWVSWESLERRRAEYDELVHKRIPANSREIAIARSYGDLSENHEYKAAKEMQKILMRRKEELEAELVRARGTDFANFPADAVGPGTVVELTDLKTGQRETLTILGAWDSDPDKGIISYLSPVAQALMGHKPGEEIEFELHGAVHRHRIENIQPYRKAPAPTAPASETGSSPVVAPAPVEGSSGPTDAAGSSDTAPPAVAQSGSSEPVAASGAVTPAVAPAAEAISQSVPTAAEVPGAGPGGAEMIPEPGPGGAATGSGRDSVHVGSERVEGSVIPETGPQTA
ncbi:GreA/GreB family elongation factor [Limisphaera sp. VF-2]|jgi:transcription elongation GreA/GreB family factor|uniref:GreA/GreB family elongation factor n=1 Tax=Limisphaera sp. VF-2 TaxID=3400418 RepID=UPI001776D275